jgi:hypothetical protein
MASKREHKHNNRNDSGARVVRAVVVEGGGGGEEVGEGGVPKVESKISFLRETLRGQ